MSPGLGVPIPSLLTEQVLGRRKDMNLNYGTQMVNYMLL